MGNLIPQVTEPSISLDLELDMATNQEDPTRLTKPRVKFTDLESKERRIRIAYLENQQAELGTEIKLLKQRGNEVIKVNLELLTLPNEFCHAI